MKQYGFTYELLRNAGQELIDSLEAQGLEGEADGVEKLLIRMLHTEYDLRGERYDAEAERAAVSR